MFHEMDNAPYVFVQEKGNYSVNKVFSTGQVLALITNVMDLPFIGHQIQSFV